MVFYGNLVLREFVWGAAEDMHIPLDFIIVGSYDEWSYLKFNQFYLIFC